MGFKKIMSPSPYPPCLQASPSLGRPEPKPKFHLGQGPRPQAARKGGRWTYSLVSLHLQNTLSQVQQDMLGGSASRGHGLGGQSFLRPLQKLRVRHISSPFYLDLLVIVRHCSQSTGHLLNTLPPSQVFFGTRLVCRGLEGPSLTA